MEILREKGFASKKLFETYQVLEIAVPAGKLRELASLPFIEFIDPRPAPLVELNDKSEALTKANLLQSPEYGLTGEGVAIQISEIGNYPQGHLDFMHRSIQGQTQLTGNYHTTHVTGIAAGAGLIDERYKGYAPKLRFLSNGPFTPNESNILNYGIDLSTNSYGSGSGCSGQVPANSVNSAVIEKMALDFPNLLNVYAAGNYGTSQCALYPAGYNTIDANSQTSKAVLTVGSVDASGMLADYSSKGPVYSGRIKPELVAPGSLIWSTVPNNGYFTNSGTSMAVPAVAGGLALLYQRYMQTHSGVKPDNALMKALVCNTATDRGTIGPDYGFGFGLMNLNRAIQTLNAGNFYKDSAAQDETRIKSITVPAGTAQLKVMLYWNDRPASPLTTKFLTNDLDLRVVTPQSATELPYVLDTIPVLITNPAKQGQDHINNIEQVVINNPAAGVYKIDVKGFAVPEGPLQTFHIVYDIVPDVVQLTYPSSGQTLVPGESVKLQWDSWGTQTSLFNLEFSSDDGSTWQLVSATIPAGSTGYDWIVPQTTTSKARFRLTRKDDNKTSLSGRFKVLGVPTLTLSTSQCPGSIAMDWTAVAGATDYEVMKYQSGEMIVIANTTQNHFVVKNLSDDSTYWVTVRARVEGDPGRRAIALSRKPDNGGCEDIAHDSDLKMDTLLSPHFGRQFTSYKLGSENIKVRVRNLDNAAISNFTIGYSVNSAAWINETVTAPVSPSSVRIYDFQKPFDFTQPGTYLIKVCVHASGDNNPVNDTLVYTIRNVANDPLSLTTAIVDDMAGAVVNDYNTSYLGLKGIERFDYSKTSSNTEFLRIANSFQQDTTGALELSYVNSNGDAPGTHALTSTYNLSQFDAATHSVALDFTYVHSNLNQPSTDSFLMRGSDTSPWIYMKNLFQNLPAGGRREVQGMAISDSLRSHGQNFSSSFQLKWAPSATYSSVVIDNVRLYNSGDDLAVVSIDSLSQSNCGLSNTTPVRITVQNRGRTTITNVSVKYRLDNGAIISETIATVAGKSSVPFTFTQRADISGLGAHSLIAWIEYPSDSYPSNNSTEFVFRNLPLIRTFPFVEDFEKGNSGWFAEGTNLSWQLGTPSSPRINSAASGTNSWKTNLAGNYNANELSYLYLGCYDLTQLQKPIISISAALNMDSCPVPQNCDLAFFQYTTNGVDWRNLLPGIQKSVQNWPNIITSLGYYRWHVMSQRLPDTLKTVQFRFQFRTNGVVNYEGLALDDLHIYDSTTLIYDGLSTALSQPINGGQEWVEFRKDGRLIAAVQPRGQDLGAVSLQAFINKGVVRNFHGQYYANRNFSLRMSRQPKDSIRVRLYITDKEADSLLFARSCLACTKIANAYRFGINIFTGGDSTSFDSSILNNTKGDWNFIANDRVKTVPFTTGYYIEFDTKNGGEIRLSNGGLDGQSPLPVRITGFAAGGNSNGAFLQWQTASEINLHHFDVEVAESNAAFTQNQFLKIGEVQSKGQSASAQTYNYTENSLNKSGVRYYRLKSIDPYGNYTYSTAQPVFFSDELNWVIYPNPSNGKFNLVYQSRPGAEVKARIYSSIGVLLKEVQFMANGFIQTNEINLTEGAFPNGIYMVRLDDGLQFRSMRVIKQ